MLVIILLLASFFIYVEFANRNSKNMTYRQKVLKAVYPAWMWWAKLRGKNAKELSNEQKGPPVSFYSLSAMLNNGDTLNFTSLQGKKVMLVNTASDCGYTRQYEDLQQLHEKYAGRLVILAFPANDFKEQEKGSDAEIAAFCKTNYGIGFPIMQKSSVIKTAQQHPVFRWLTDATQNGWNTQPPSWNFTKYLVNEKGVLVNYFGASISPLHPDIVQAIEHE